jgi:hypothetical protein
MKLTQDFALLAPVPLEHLLSGRELLIKKDFVAFGTRKWELLRTIDELRGHGAVPVLIYPSHEEVPAENSFVVSWFGWYVGHVEAPNGKHPSGMEFRPSSTAKYPNDNQGYWAAFWHLRGLRELSKDKRLTIGKIGTVKGGWRKNAPPRGPELVAFPEVLHDEDE